MYKKGGGNMGKIADTNTRTNITISKEMKEQLTNIAKSENRSFNNLVITILKDYLTNKGQ
jgi:predicted HicB family RNase H-like nuclease